MTDAARLERARALFRARGRTPAKFQEAMWQAYWRGESGLLNAATGTGKTLAAWLGPVIEAGDGARAAGGRVGGAGRDGARPGDVGGGDARGAAGIRVVWVTPLRALARDLESALRDPLTALGSTWRVEQRTGDTSSSRRRSQLTRPPEALITTPESLSVMLSDARFAAALGAVDALIVDEWHEFLGTKRGVQLELVAARLRALNPDLRVWGLSATLPDFGGAMAALLGPERRGVLVRADVGKRYVIESVLPAAVERFPWSGHLGLKLLPEVLRLIEGKSTTLIFTNTRSQCEAWYQAIVSARLDWLTVTALHHGSIDAKIRRRIEEGLKDGSLRCVVCTSSLDLGVDFPPVDQVLQIGSPKGVARLLQRAGRSGHRPGEASHITLVPTHALELLECAAARHAAERLTLEPRRGLTLALDVLAQHLVTLAAGGGFDAAEALREARSTHAFARLDEMQWQWTLDFITRGGAALQGYPQFRRVVREGERYGIVDEGMARRHRRAIGTITSQASVSVKWVSGGTLGHVEESFIGRLKKDDVFVFAGRALRLVRLRESVAYVRLAGTRSRFVPRWQGTRLPLSQELGAELEELLGDFLAQGARDPELVTLAPLLRVQANWSALPTAQRFLIEFHDTREGHHLFAFPFAGRLLNEGVAALMAARAARHSPRTFSITTNEYGFEMLCEEPLDFSEAQLREWLGPQNLLEDLLASVNLSDLARRQFRDIARIAGLVDAGTPGRPKSSRQLQASSALMFDVLERHDTGNLLLAQSRREVLEAQLDHSQLGATLERLSGREWVIRHPPRLTPLSFPLWADRLQTQTLSTETWQARVEREARRLDKLAR